MLDVENERRLSRSSEREHLISERETFLRPTAFLFSFSLRHVSFRSFRCRASRSSAHRTRAHRPALRLRLVPVGRDLRLQRHHLDRFLDRHSHHGVHRHLLPSPRHLDIGDTTTSTRVSHRLLQLHESRGSGLLRVRHHRLRLLLAEQVQPSVWPSLVLNDLDGHCAHVCSHDPLQCVGEVIVLFT